MPHTLRAKAEAIGAYHLLITPPEKQAQEVPSTWYTPGAAGGRNSAVECLLPKQMVVGSNPIARSSFNSARGNMSHEPVLLISDKQVISI